MLVVFVVVAAAVGHRFPEAVAQAARPNVILVVTDDQDYDSLPVMRNLLSYPEGAWVNFSNAVVNDSICCPARATLLTGQYSLNHLVASNNLGYMLDDRNTLPVWLDEAGYQTILVGKYLNGYPWTEPAGYKPPGWDVFDESLGHGLTRQLTAKATDYIAAADAPFFLYLSYKAPHKPAIPSSLYANADVYVPPDRASFNEADVSDKPTWIRGLPRLSNDTIALNRKERLNAQRELLDVDDGIMALIDALKAKNQLDNTMIIFTSDNGFSWGNHRRYGKWCPYDECSRVPFFIRYPGLDENRTEPGAVSLVDIAGTIAAYVGVEPGRRQDGRNLLPLIERRSGVAEAWQAYGVLLEKKLGKTTSYYAVRTPGWKYVEYRNGDRELYDLVADPDELDNLAGKPAYADDQARLAAQLAGLLSQEAPTLYTVSGRVTTADGTGIGGVVVTDGAGRKATTAANGTYTLRGIAAGVVTLTPSKANTTFEPPSASVTLPPNATGVDFIGTSTVTYKLSGTVTKAGRGVAGVTISVGDIFTTTTNARGSYKLQGLPAGTYTLTPTMAGLYFVPESLVVTVPPNRTGRNFKAVTGFNIVGRVTTRNGTAIKGALVEAGAYQATTTNTGQYRLLNLPPGTYTLTVSRPGFVFNQPAPVTVPPNANRVNIIGARE